MSTRQPNREFLEAILEQREFLRSEMAEITKDKKRILEQEDRVLKALMGLDMFIAELQTRASGALPKPTDVNLAQPAPVQEIVPDNVEQRADSDAANNDFSPTWFVRTFILEHANNGGASAAAIKKAAEAVGHKASNFPYGTLNRLKSRKEIRRQRGHYYPTEAMPKDRTGEDIE